MAIYIPIVSEFKSDGIDKARKEFKSLESVGAKASYAIKKAALPAAAALGGVALALGDAVKGAIEDAAAQQMLATQLKNSAGANDEMIKAVEGSISAMSAQLGIADDELRPAFSNLVRSTKDVTRAQQLMSVAADIAAQTGKPLETVTVALAKAEQGQYAALKKLGIPMGDNIRALMDQATETKKVAKAQANYDAAVAGGASAKEQAAALAKLTEAQQRLSSVTVEGADYVTDLNKAFGGAADAAANTAAGSLKRFTIGIAEAKESIGAALLPMLEKVLPVLNKFGTWAQENTGTFIAIAGVIGGLAASIVVANAALGVWNTITAITAALNGALAASFTAVQVASGLIVFTAIIAGLVIAYNKFEWFRNGVKAVFEGIGTAIGIWADLVKAYFNGLFTVFKAVFNGIASIWNNTVGKLKFTLPTWIPGIGGKGFDMPNIPMLADGGIVMNPTLALIGEAGAEAVIPLDRMNDFGGGGGVTINVNGGDPQAVVDALRKYYRQNGNLPVGVAY